MEKFQRWNDGRSGINPFVPRQGPILRAAGTALALPLLAVAPLALLRAVLLVFPVLFLFISSAIVDATQESVPFVSLLARQFGERLWSRVTLFVLGFWTLPVQQFKARQVGLKASKTAEQRQLRAGDVLVANSVSYLEPLVLSSMYGCGFLLPTQSGNLLAGSVMAAVRYATRAAPVTGGVDGEAAAKLARRSMVPVALMAEGGHTNGQAVLTFCDAARQLAVALPADQQCFCVLVRFTEAKGAFSATYTAGPVALHAALLCGRLTNGVTVCRLPAGHDPQPADFAGDDQGDGHGGADVVRRRGAGVAEGDAAAGWGEASQQALVALLRGKPVQLSGEDYADFRTLYDTGKLPADKQGRQANGGYVARTYN